MEQGNGFTSPAAEDRPEAGPPFEEPLIKPADAADLYGDHDAGNHLDENGNPKQHPDHKPVVFSENHETGGTVMKNEAAHGQVGVGWTTINMMCNVIGGGVLALPTAFHQSSLLLGFVLMFFVTAITSINLYFIVHCADFARIYSYRILLRKGLGKIESACVDFALFVFPFGATCAYCRIVADSMPPVIINFLGASKDSFFASSLCWLIAGGVIFFILSCRRSLNELKITSLFGLATIFYLVILVIVRFFDGSYAKTHTPAEVRDDFEVIYLSWDIFRTIPLIAFALSVHNNAPTYYEELKDRSPERMMKVVKISHAAIITTYLLMAVFGLITFGNTIEEGEGDILNMYHETDALINSARLLMFVHFACVYPILHMAARRGFNNFFLKTNDLKLSTLCVESFFMVLTSVIIGGLVPNIDTLLGVIGALFGSLIVMIAPSLLFLRIDPFNSAATGGGMKSKVMAVISICVGVISGVIGVTVTIMDVVHNASE